MTQQEKIERIWREFGRQEVTIVPPNYDMIYCRHYVSKSPALDAVLPPKVQEFVTVDEPVPAVILDNNPELKVGQCGACSCIYWFVGEMENVLRVDKDTVPDFGGAEEKAPVYASEEDRLVQEAMEKVEEWNLKEIKNRTRHRRIDRGRRS